MLFEILLLIIGLALLVKFSDYTIKNCVKLSKLTGISQIAIGFILIAVATSLPELTIAITSSVEGEGILSFGNLVGANISNLALIFGLVAISGFTISRKEFDEIADAIIVTSVIAIFLFFLGFADAVFGLFCLILFFMFSDIVMKSGIKIKNYKTNLKTPEIVKSIAFVLVSVAFVIIGAYITTNSALNLARIFGMAETAIGGTILAIGTTLPELSVGIAAIRKRNVDLAIGDGIGSIVTNLTLILGIASIIHPITFESVTNILLISLIVINIIFLFLARRLKFGKKEGIILILIYVVYLFVIFSSAL